MSLSISALDLADELLGAGDAGLRAGAVDREAALELLGLGFAEVFRAGARVRLTEAGVDRLAALDR